MKTETYSVYFLNNKIIIFIFDFIKCINLQNSTISMIFPSTCNTPNFITIPLNFIISFPISLNPHFSTQALVSLKASCTFLLSKSRTIYIFMAKFRTYKAKKVLTLVIRMITETIRASN